MFESHVDVQLNPIRVMLLNEQQSITCKQVKENGTEENMLMHIEWINLVLEKEPHTQ